MLAQVEKSQFRCVLGKNARRRRKKIMILGCFISGIQLFCIQKHENTQIFQHFFNIFNQHSFWRHLRSRPSVRWMHEEIRTGINLSGDTTLT